MENKCRILIYSYNYYPEPIGIAPLMTELAEGLAKQGHQIRVVTAMPHYPEFLLSPKYRDKFFLTEEINGVTIQRSYIFVTTKRGVLNRLMSEGSFMTSSIYQLFNGWQPEVILATTPPLLTPLPLYLYTLFSHCPIILNIQDIVSEAAVRVNLLRENSLTLSLVEAIENIAHQKASKISVIAEEFCPKLVDKDVPKNKIIHISNWVDVNFIRPLEKNNSFRTKHHLEGKFVALYAGNIALTQPIEIIIEAAASLQHIPEIMFVIVGEEKALARLEKICQEHEANNVLLLPFVKRKELPKMYSAADVGLVLQNRNVTEFNLPSKIPMILASGRPIVASVPDTGTAEKVVKKSGGGVVVPAENPQALADAVLDLYKNPEHTQVLGQQGRKYAEEHFSFEQALEKYQDLFGDILNSSRTSH